MSFKYKPCLTTKKGKKYINQSNNILKNKRKKQESTREGSSHSSAISPIVQALQGRQDWLTSFPSLLSAAKEREFANQQKWWLACSRLCFLKTNIHQLLPLTCSLYDSLCLYKGSSVYTNILPSCAFLHFTPKFFSHPHSILISVCLTLFHPFCHVSNSVNEWSVFGGHQGAVGRRRPQTWSRLERMLLEEIKQLAGVLEVHRLIS